MELFKKLSKIRKEIGVIFKDGKVAYGSTKYDYVSSKQVLACLNELINKEELFLITQVVNQKITNINIGFLTEIELKYTWINSSNPDERLDCSWFGQGIDNLEKGIGKALTYSEKYFLLKFFNIETDKLDPDHQTYQNKIDDTKFKGRSQQFLKILKEYEKDLKNVHVASFVNLSKEKDLFEADKSLKIRFKEVLDKFVAIAINEINIDSNLKDKYKGLELISMSFKNFLRGGDK